MLFAFLISFFLAVVPAIARTTGPKYVFAHFIVGNADAMNASQWESDIREARAAHIDGFALNIATQDSYTDTVLDKAYAAAEKVGNFTLFLSFDYESGGAWPEDRVIATINKYKSSSAQQYYEGKPFVSTFGGSSSASDWSSIKSSADCYFVPSWTDLGPTGITEYLDVIDGAFSWDAWPNGAENMTTVSDEAWIKALAGKTYMMPVSPWFYTNLPEWSKNWLWRGDDLWHTRWSQAADLQPTFVEIITWNDYGETHYIGPIHEEGLPTGSASYVLGHPHDAWRTLLPHYINAYRGGASNSTLSYDDKLVFWYHINPGESGSANGTTGNNPEQGQTAMSPGLLAQDSVFVTALTSGTSKVRVQIGSSEPTVLSAVGAGIQQYSVPFNGRTGEVQVSIQRNGRVTANATGRAITDDCEEGNVNWNAIPRTLSPQFHPPAPMAKKNVIGLREAAMAYRPSSYAQLPDPVQDYSPPAPRTAQPAQATAVKPEDFSKPYCDFMTNNPTIFHAVDGFTKQLESQGYKRLPEREAWTSKLQRGGKYYTTRNASAFIAFSIGQEYQTGNGLAIVAGHIDALTAKLKPVSKLPTKAGYTQLGVAPYAGALNETWWDRDLAIGGRVLVRDPASGKVESKLVKLDWPIARVPTLAPHFGAPSQGPFNKETQMVPIIGVDNSDLFRQTEAVSPFEAGTFAATQPEKLVKVISSELGVTDYRTILNWELELYDSQPAQLGGLEKDLIFAGRIDDKLCCFAAQEALLASPDSTSPGSIKMVGMFDDEEIGSLLRQGARSNFMSSVIERITEAFAPNYGPNVLAQTVANSFFVSSDVIHAVNPNFLGVYLENHAPRLNVGVAVSADSNGHMTTDSVSHGFMKRVAEKCGSTLQVFQIRNDSRSGGTIGPMTSSRIGMRAIDVGIPQLSMHSIRATTGSLDPGLGVKLFKGFFDHFEEVDKEFADF
ncbi:hypothetical protein BO71DRAFT_406224 [Aspergillus ellipticus CBS 707.79]|uniref:Glycosyl hydrolase family 71-domain-containing protein n=1 Tax=Aspergillus ellipticus CBS 707.79 TaxID=1448320 RepID=A0A319DLG6_9EURO|nr:hypothetical protein BO71DRAFT_406224 [Aspergillus ellipticus CBS 707.79]